MIKLTKNGKTMLEFKKVVNGRYTENVDSNRPTYTFENLCSYAKKKGYKIETGSKR